MQLERLRLYFVWLSCMFARSYLSPITVTIMERINGEPLHFRTVVVCMMVVSGIASLISLIRVFLRGVSV